MLLYPCEDTPDICPIRALVPQIQHPYGKGGEGGGEINSGSTENQEIRLRFSYYRFGSHQIGVYDDPTLQPIPIIIALPLNNSYINLLRNSLDGRRCWPKATALAAFLSSPRSTIRSTWIVFVIFR